MPMSDGKDVAYALLIVLNDNKAETQSNFSVTAIQKYQLSDDDKLIALDEHNRLRDSLEGEDRHGEEFQGFPVGMNKLEWDEDLEQTAQEVADQCKKKHLSYRGPLFEQLELEMGSIGENLAYGSQYKPARDVGDYVRSWYSEIKHFDWNTLECTPSFKCLHLTQMLWGESEYLGCAQKKCTSTWKSGKTKVWTNFVCHYSPAGNWWGELPFGVNPARDPIAMCPNEGNQIDNVYSNLCTGA
ncbi:venom allergen 5-like [Symsagittifera roscoffensis]|uniref:venom allergen 5-like n=1 Tax=Symsagittifera roscoffensis TaxID=84072 RepID=UPI00307B243C